MNITQAMRALRQQLGMRVAAIAAAVGVSKSTVYRWARGEHQPEPANLIALRAAVDRWHQAAVDSDYTIRAETLAWVRRALTGAPETITLPATGLPRQQRRPYRSIIAQCDPWKVVATG